ncbi:MAG: (Fe-S)-binding protein [Candidatus Freyarchaeota archaeon]|nr:(Fe-S)-binding protein [Candidatus Jordarchaeia archaeon]MBS7269374.1 (Fe-S)-binding protein [Candidatus Jordarchaeia archaeon]MBS7278297.1 (Fe-S)-binding protein [Candidatus Jordarchaeia archaeon]
MVSASGSTISDIVKYCYQCGKCVGTCPVSGLKNFNPRLMIHEILLNGSECLVRSDDIWSCLTCDQCSAICPMGIEFSKFVRGARAESFKRGICGEEAHTGILSTITKIMANSNLTPNILGDWFPSRLKIQDKGEYAYFVGCLPIFDRVFANIGGKYSDIAVAAVAILNELGITPVVMKDAKCCGHDRLWSGDIETFRVLAEHNLQAIDRTEASTLITTCAECYRTFKLDYPEHFGELPFEVIHMSEFLADQIGKGKLDYPVTDKKKVTYHDPCRLGRQTKVFDAPRNVIKSIPELSFVEMDRIREDSLCCGTSSFLSCNDYAKAIRVDRMSEAERTGAEVLVTTCPKCQIHFNCLKNEVQFTDSKTKRYDFEITDLTILVAQSLKLI